jgi:NAD-dependent deacetylase
MTFPLLLIERLRRAEYVTALTGAGISAESGVPTFRDAQSGLWSKYKPEDLATPEAFQRNPQLVWEWYAWRRECVAKVLPNAGHLALAEMERRAPRFSLITQNVDGLHHRAGSKRVIELHGNITRTKCFEENAVIQNWIDRGETPPRCPRCGGRLRPDVVWFGETLPVNAFNEALEASRTCDIFFSIGTSSVVYPASSLAHEALQCGALVVEINPDKTPLTAQATFAFQTPSGRLLPLLLEAAWPLSED